MRSLLARLAVVGAFAVSVSACGGNGTSLPYGGAPNNAGGNSGIFQSGSNGQALIRFIQGSPDANPASPTGSVDVCIDNLAYGITAPTVAYGKQSASLYAIAGGIPHTVAVYATAGANAGAQCASAPGPYLGTSAIAAIAISTAAGARQTVVLGGSKASTTLGLYVFTEPTFPVAPGGPEAISHNAAPAFSAATASKSVGFGTCSTTVTPCATAVALTGAGSLAAPKASTAASVTANAAVTSGLGAIPAGLYDGAGVAAGTPVPITSVAAVNAAGQPFVEDLYAIDGPAGGLNLVAYLEATTGYGF